MSSGPQQRIELIPPFRISFFASLTADPANPTVPSSVAGRTSTPYPSNSSKSMSSFLVLAPKTKVTLLLEDSSDMTRLRGVTPVPPATTSRLSLSLTLNQVPYGPLTPIRSPGCSLWSSSVASPTTLTTISADPSIGSLVTLIGISSNPGTHTMANCPGRAISSVSSWKCKDLTVGDLSTILVILTALGLSSLLSSITYLFYSADAKSVAVNAR